MPPTPTTSTNREEIKITPSLECQLTINGQNYSLGEDVSPETTLLRFIRDYAQLKGTKSLCHEGGCGLCTVVATFTDPETNEPKSKCIRSCQTLVYSCIGWSITTVEHLGDRYTGYDKLQVALHGFYGTQCGYCTPGFVMTMKGQMESSKNLTSEQIEKSFDGNICRCTGYRPILEAFKSFASDAPEELTSKLKDIEDVYDIIKQKRASVYKNDGPYSTFVNTTGVTVLYDVTLQPSLVIGANVSLARCIELFQEAAKNNKGYRHLTEIAKHWGVVANVGVRNMGSWAGNMRMKYDHNEFTSDIFVTLVALEAKLKIGRCDGDVTEVSPEEFLSTDMNKSFILSMKIPQQPDNVRLHSYKITPRAVNAHAYVNACFRFHLDAEEQRVINRPAIVLGGINPSFIRASKTEQFLIGKVLSNVDEVQKAIQLLGEEVNPQFNYADASPEFRRNLSQCLLYKTVVKILGDAVPSPIKSAGPKLERPVSSSKQTYDANEDTWPVGKPTEKLESRLQISGEAEYLDDIPFLPGELHGYFVQSTIGRGKIKSIEASKCLEMDGVVDFITAKDIPGRNTFYAASSVVGNDPVFADIDIKYHGQAIGLVVAKSREIAKAASVLVNVTYEDIQKPILTIKETMEADNRYQKTMNFFTNSTDPLTFGDVEEGFKNSKHIVEGEISMGSQCHFTMEPLAGRTVPTEEGYDLWCTTQWATETVNAVASNLGIPANSINISVRRIGGGYGGKISRANITASASAVAAHKLKKPVRVALDLSTQMTLVGWREPYYSRYKVGFSDEGLLQSIFLEICSDAGFVANDVSSFFCALTVPSVYYCPNWKMQCYSAITDTPANTWCRTPAHVEAIGIVENIIERVAFEVKRDPLEVRELNFSTKEKPNFVSERKGENLVQKTILPLLKEQAEINVRRNEILKFNKENKWKKRGISVIPLLYRFDMVPFFVFNVQVVIYEYDGAVAIKHGGVEMGQGINTKVAQVAAKILGIPLDLIKVKPTDSFVAANSAVTGGSYGSDINAHGVKICCEKLSARIEECAKKHNIERKESTWTELIKKCFQEQVDLKHPDGYDIWAAACTEVELDTLTGQFLILRSDIIEDCGRSLSPYVDMGQVEGAFVMGLGFFTSEKVKYDPETGQKLSNGTWEYKPPTALDIPIDFRVSFLPKGDNEGGVLRSKDTPLTVDKLHELCEIDTKQLIF
ncbi:Indole-3-acetaldehyde oxidase [Armadillidium nasatum]|uniref:Indole-3-acetaldehyde oxidase n=1 Tax=Armadillidium nasatum TaxID=96803 RepID=A0A5N5TLL8_9CRUS|nr:Indole-3-acetaldehyde oxidase [Armadillidium nasatum]